MNAVVEFKREALGITHKALRAAIKKFGILEPRPDDGQGDLFEEGAA